MVNSSSFCPQKAWLKITIVKKYVVEATFSTHQGISTNRFSAPQRMIAGSIIIMHVNGRGWHTSEALPTIIDTLREQGYIFVTVSELLGIE